MKTQEDDLRALRETNHGLVRERDTLNERIRIGDRENHALEVKIAKLEGDLSAKPIGRATIRVEGGGGSGSGGGGGSGGAIEEQLGELSRLRRELQEQYETFRRNQSDALDFNRKKIALQVRRRRRR